jgi:flagellar motility protein MotE (MotC chaperone)
MNEAVEKNELGAFERFLYWFLIPIVFVSVLLVVLLTLFGYDTKASLLKTAHAIPVIGNFVPNPAAAKTSAAPGGTGEGSKADTQQVSALSDKVKAKDEELKKSDELYLQKDQALKDLQAKYTQLEEQTKDKAKTDDEYLNQIKQTSSMYAAMNPSKSAPILENLTMNERVLIFSEMKQADQVKILEKMDPKKAAETSIALKDLVPAKDRQIAALQDKVKQLEAAGSTAAAKLSATDLGQTFGGMTPKNAAAVLIEMYAKTPDKVVAILSSASTQSRSQIMSAMADIKKETAAAISQRLAP